MFSSENCDSRVPISAFSGSVNILGTPAKWKLGNDSINFLINTNLFWQILAFCVKIHLRKSGNWISAYSPWKHSLASPAIRTASPLWRNMAMGVWSLDLPPRRKIALQPKLMMPKIFLLQHIKQNDIDRRKNIEHLIESYLMLTIGLLQSFSMSSRCPPSISPEKNDNNYHYCFRMKIINKIFSN